MRKRDHRLNSLRLKGFDYSEPGAYFVTMCTKNRACNFGQILDGRMILSPVARIVETCWWKIPEHFKNTRVAVFQIMPNHLHGIIVIKEEPVRVEYIQPRQGTRGSTYQHVQAGSLSSIIRCFKAEVTREVNRRNGQANDTLWQRSFYDHIIRDDVSHFFIQQYIELNPLLWYLDSDNPDINELSIDSLRNMLKTNHGLSGMALEYVIEHETDYRNWRASQL